MQWLPAAVASDNAGMGSEARGLSGRWFSGSRAQAHWLCSTGLVALRHAGSSWTRDRTRVSWIGMISTNEPPGKPSEFILNISGIMF